MTGTELFFDKLSKEAPELFKELLSWAVTYYDNLTGKITSTPINPEVGSRINITADEGTGSYTLVSKPVPESVRSAIRENFAHGIIYEEAGQWLSGFITGFMMGAGV